MSSIATSQMAILTALRNANEMTIDDLDKQVDIDHRFIVNSCGRLLYAGFVQRMEIGVYRITPKGLNFLGNGKVIKSGKPGLRNGLRSVPLSGLRQRLWNAIRQYNAGGQRKSFSLPDLLTIALNEDEEPEAVNENASQYIRHLKKAGYLVALARRQRGTRPGSNGFMLYKLARDTGEKPPVVRARRKTIFDQNTNETFTW